MSVRATTAVWDFSEAPSHVVLVVALALADHADHSGEVHMTLPRVAEQARVSRSTVWQAIRTLKDLGELVVIHQSGGRPGDGNIYRLTLVDNLAQRVREPDPSGLYTGPARVRDGSGLSDAKPNSLDTNNAPDRDLSTAPPAPLRLAAEPVASEPWEPRPPAELAEILGPIRAQLKPERKRR